jgi:hypothetical protein
MPNGLGRFYRPELQGPADSRTTRASGDLVRTQQGWGAVKGTALVSASASHRMCNGLGMKRQGE